MKRLGLGRGEVELRVSAKASAKPVGHFAGGMGIQSCSLQASRFSLYTLTLTHLGM